MKAAFVFWICWIILQWWNLESCWCGIVLQSTKRYVLAWLWCPLAMLQRDWMWYSEEWEHNSPHDRTVGFCRKMEVVASTWGMKFSLKYMCWSRNSWMFKESYKYINGNPLVEESFAMKCVWRLAFCHFIDILFCRWGCGLEDVANNWAKEVLPLCIYW